MEIKSINIVSGYKKMFNFLEEPASANALAFFRISVAFLCVIQCYFIYCDLLNIYGSNGIIQWEIGKTLLEDWKLHLSDWTSWLAIFGINEDTSIFLLFYVYIAALFCLLIGWQTRIMTIITWLIHLVWLNTGTLFNYGVDMFIHISLFYFIFMPVEAAFSIDNLKNKYLKISSSYGLSLKVLQIHLCVVYFWSGMEKTPSMDWWTGEAIWKSIMMSEFNQIDVSWLSSFSWIPMIIGWSVLFLEIGYALFVWFNKTRGIWILCTIGMHIGIGIFLGLWLFAFMMIILNIVAFGWEYIERYAAIFK